VLPDDYLRRVGCRGSQAQRTAAQAANCCQANRAAVKPFRREDRQQAPNRSYARAKPPQRSDLRTRRFGDPSFSFRSGTPVTAEFAIGAYHQLFQIEKSFRMAKSDLQARPVYYHLRESIEGHLTLPAYDRLGDTPVRRPHLGPYRRHRLPARGLRRGR
jgi:hypothetical protein